MGDEIYLVHDIKSNFYRFGITWWLVNDDRIFIFKSTKAIFFSVSCISHNSSALSFQPIRTPLRFLQLQSDQSCDSQLMWCLIDLFDYNTGINLHHTHHHKLDNEALKQLWWHEPNDDYSTSTAVITTTASFTTNAGRKRATVAFCN